MQKEIKKNKLYSTKEALDFIPWINTTVTFHKMIREDAEKNNSQKYGAIIIKRNSYQKYYLKGENILKLIEERYGK